MADVLVVDDDADIRMLLVLALEDAGHAVRQAADGAEAIAVVEAKAPDAMVLDVMMPGTDGIAVIRSLRARRVAPDTKILLLTTKISERDHLRGWGVGADDYATKPFDPMEIVQRVRWLLQAPDDVRAARREEELHKTELLDRLEAAFAERRGRTAERLGGNLNRS